MQIYPTVEKWKWKFHPETYQRWIRDWLRQWTQLFIQFCLSQLKIIDIFLTISYIFFNAWRYIYYAFRWICLTWLQTLWIWIWKNIPPCINKEEMALTVKQNMEMQCSLGYIMALLIVHAKLKFWMMAFSFGW